MTKGVPVGRVAALWRYPVQSLQGETLAAVRIGPEGVPGDRAFGLLDPAEGHIATAAKGKRKWRGLVTAAARLLPEEDGAPAAVEIRLPDRMALRSDMPDVDAALSAAFGLPLRLVRKGEAPPAYRHAPLHLLTTASLRRFAADYPAGRFEPARFRPNLLIETEAVGFPEQGWIGRTLAIGEALRLRVEEHCKRCVMTVLPQGALPQDPGILATVNALNEARAGVYAAVIAPGPARPGETVRLLD